MPHSPNRKAIDWLQGELPSLVSANVISADCAAALKAHYAGQAKGSTNFGFVLLAIIGSVLIGAGVILLIAHNWDQLSRGARCVIAFAPLVASQALGAFVLMRRNESQAWRETAAILNVAAVGSAISLISQTYQIQGTLDQFMLTWLLLSVPIVYLFRTWLGAMLFVVGCVEWLFARGFWLQSRSPLVFWPVLLLIVPFFVIGFRQARESRGVACLGIFLLGATVVGLGFTAEFTDACLFSLSLAGLFTATYLFGIEFFPRDDRARLHSLALLGGLGIGVLAVILSFKDLWEIAPSTKSFGLHATGIAIQLLFPLAALVLAAARLVAGGGRRFSLVAAAFPLVVAVAWGISRVGHLPGSGGNGTRYDFISALLLNVYVLGLGVEFLARGIKSDSLARANFGLLLIAALATARFFDSDVSFMTRGIGFILIGIGFLAANVFLFKRRAAVAA